MVSQVVPDYFTTVIALVEVCGAHPRKFVNGPEIQSLGFKARNVSLALATF